MEIDFTEIIKHYFPEPSEQQIALELLEISFTSPKQLKKEVDKKMMMLYTGENNDEEEEEDELADAISELLDDIEEEEEDD